MTRVRANVMETITRGMKSETAVSVQVRTCTRSGGTNNSPLIVAPYQADDNSPNLTSPTKLADEATKCWKPYCGALPLTATARVEGSTAVELCHAQLRDVIGVQRAAQAGGVYTVRNGAPSLVPTCFYVAVRVLHAHAHAVKRLSDPSERSTNAPHNWSIDSLHSRSTHKERCEMAALV